jgi:alpha-galactosidase
MLEEERKRVNEFVSSYLTSSETQPFSFIYDGKSSCCFLKKWNSRHIEVPKKSKSSRILVSTYKDPKTNLFVKCKCNVLKNFPAIEWVLTFRNEGEDDTPIIKDINDLDVRLKKEIDKDYILYHALGSSASRNDFAPLRNLLSPNSRITLKPQGGRSSNVTSFPFFNIQDSDGGVMVAIGWSGQWKSEILRDEVKSLAVKAGLELTHLKLHPGESIRTARILLLFWHGKNRLRGHNMLRQFILENYETYNKGKPVVMPLACMDRKYGGEEANRATEQDQITIGKRFSNYGLEYLWIDAGWFEGGWPFGRGNWFIRKDNFPRGLKPVSETIKKYGMGLILWFEPENVWEGTWLDMEHAEWILRLPNNQRGLLNLGNPEARRWITEHISKMIKQEGISIYRQDFNLDPLPYWRAFDKVDRQGITEIRHIEGLYTFWDELLAKHPGLIIDNCASGGRRIDLETVSRSIILWRTDYKYGESNGQHSHTYGISFYLPTTSTGCFFPNTYSFRSAMNAGVCLIQTYDWSDSELGHIQSLVDDFKRIRPFFFGNYYPLTTFSTSDDIWIAFQFHRQDMDAGMFLAFRRPTSPYITIQLNLCELNPKEKYEVTFEDTKKKNVFIGKDLQDGIKITINDKPGSFLATYHQIT